MSAIVLLPPQTIAAEPVRRKQFTRQDVDRITEAGVFEGQRYELIDGDLIDKMGQNAPHATALSFILAVLRFLDGKLIRSQSAIEASEEDHEGSLPEPDTVPMEEWKSDFNKRRP